MPVIASPTRIAMLSAFRRPLAARCAKLGWTKICLLIGVVVLAGCVAANTGDLPGGETATSERAEVRYYIGKLPDRDYVETYGGDEHPRTWYTAAEALGEIGKPAIPALVNRLHTPDPYELKLALYALMLASQDPELMAETDGDYLRLTTVLTPDTNEENRTRALVWWERYRPLFP